MYRVCVCVWQCGTIEDDGPNEGLTERSLQDAQRLFLMNDVVQPISVDPLVWQDDVRFSKLVVDIVQGQDTLHHVMYIGTGTRGVKRGKRRRSPYFAQVLLMNVLLTLYKWSKVNVI